jgi:hypothetical protein
MRTIERSTQFKKDYKKYFKSVYGSELDARVKEVIGHLLADHLSQSGFATISSEPTGRDIATVTSSRIWC